PSLSFSSIVACAVCDANTSAPNMGSVHFIALIIILFLHARLSESQVAPSPRQSFCHDPAANKNHYFSNIYRPSRTKPGWLESPKTLDFGRTLQRGFGRSLSLPHQLLRDCRFGQVWVQFQSGFE